MSIVDFANEIEKEQEQDSNLKRWWCSRVPPDAFVRLLRILVSVGFPNKVESLLSFDSFDVLIAKIFDGTIDTCLAPDFKKRCGDYHKEFEFAHDFSKEAWVATFDRVFHGDEIEEIEEIHPIVEDEGDENENEEGDEEGDDDDDRDDDDDGDEDGDEEGDEDEDVDNDYVEEKEDGEAYEDRLITYGDLMDLREKVDAIHTNLLAAISVVTIFTAIAIPGAAALAYYAVFSY